MSVFDVAAYILKSTRADDDVEAAKARLLFSGMVTGVG